METIDHRGVAKLDPMGMNGTIFYGDYLKLLHTKYRSSGPFGFREADFFSFSRCKSMRAICCHMETTILIYSTFKPNAVNPLTQ